MQTRNSIYVSVASHNTELALLQALLEVIAEHRGLAKQLVTWAVKQLARIKQLELGKLSVEIETQQWQDIGADGLDTVTQRERLGDTINDLTIERLGPFSREHARGFLTELASNYQIDLSAEANQRMLDKIGWLIPYHLQLVFSMVRDLDVPAPGVDDIEQGYQRLLSNHHKGYFDPWYQRLRDELGPVDEGHALSLLEAAARDFDGAPHAVMQELMRSRGVDPHVARYLLGVLESDGYLIEAAQRWCFRSPLLRDYWRAQVLA